MNLYSYSKISSFEQCKLKYKYKYIDRIKSDIPDTVETFLGKRVHETLEKLYKDLKFTKKNTKEELLLFLESEWNSKWSDDILIVKNDYTQENYLEMGKKFVSDYYDKYQPFNQAVTIGTEMHIKIKLDADGIYQLQGYIDRVDSKGGIYEVHDYKTASSLPIQEYLDQNRQLAIYAIAIKELYKDAKEVKLIWHYLSFNKELTSERTNEQLENLKVELIKIIGEIETCNDFPSTTSTLCDWCEYKSICPQWKHLRMDKEIRSRDDGVKYVNEYARLKKEETDIKKKLDTLKELIIRYADDNDVDAVFGTDIRAKVWARICEKFPRTTDSSYRLFENKVKNQGLWEEFSRLDGFKLEKAFESKKLSPEIMQVLRAFVRREKIERIYMGLI